MCAVLYALRKLLHLVNMWNKKSLLINVLLTEWVSKDTAYMYSAVIFIQKETGISLKLLIEEYGNGKC